jgi:hypothetical protein
MNNWLAVTTTARVSSRASTTKNPNVLRITTDHRVLANGKWRKASDLLPGHELVTSRYAPSSAVIHLVRSSMLGDGCLAPSAMPGDAWFREGHTTRKNGGEYAAALHRWMGGCAMKLTGPDGFGVVQSKGYAAFGALRREWYPVGRKVVPADLTWADDFTVAKWYMDDGCLAPSAQGRQGAHFATNSFRREDVERLGILLNERYGVWCHLMATPSGPVLGVSPGLPSRGNDIRRLWEAIAPHVVPAMRYKLPDDYREVDYKDYPAGRETLEVTEAIVADVHALDSSRCTNSWSRTAYDVRTDTGNFLAKNVLVHNCDYGGMDDLVLLGAVNIATGESVGPDWISLWPGPVTETMRARTLAEALALPPREGCEGVVVRSADGTMTKIKQAAYVALHRILTMTTARTVWEYLAVDACKHLITAPKHWGSRLSMDPERAAEILAVGPDWLARLTEGVPDEFHGWLRSTIGGILARVDGQRTYLETEAAALIEAHGGDRKTFALAAKDHPDAGALFLLLDGKDITFYLWKGAYPPPEKAWGARSEDVA